MNTKLNWDGSQTVKPNVVEHELSGEGVGAASGRSDVSQVVGNPVKIEGLGSIGRSTPNSINEQMAMHQVQSDPLNGAFKVPLKMNDSRWPESSGWSKMQNVVTTSDGSKIIIHFNYNEITGAFDDFKFK